MTGFVETLEVVQNIQASSSPDEICQELLRVTSRYGLTNLIAGTFNFGPAELFVIEKPEEKEAPKVSFS